MSMLVELILSLGFWRWSLIGTALGMLLSRNAIYSALFLVLNFATVALLYLILGRAFHRPGADDRLCRRHHGVVPVCDYAAGRRKIVV